MKFLLQLITLIVISGHAAGANLRFIQDSVLTKFSEMDIAAFKKFVADKLDTIPDGEIGQWQSQTSTLVGKLKPKFTHTTQGITCRRTAFYVADKQGQSEQYQFDICKIKQKWQIMKTPASSFKASDWEMLREVGTNALNSDIDGEPLSWFNPKTKHSGVFVPSALFKLDNRECRKLAISISSAKGTTSNGAYIFCKDAGNEWQRYIEHP